MLELIVGRLCPKKAMFKSYLLVPVSEALFGNSLCKCHQVKDPRMRSFRYRVNLRFID